MLNMMLNGKQSSYTTHAAHVTFSSDHLRFWSKVTKFILKIYSNSNSTFEICMAQNLTVGAITVKFNSVKYYVY